jgi:hypothetical protein
MLDFDKVFILFIFILIILISFQQTISVGLCKSLNNFMPYPLDYARFIESTYFLGPKAFTYKKIGPIIILL